ncbi:hypothetical protein N0V86_005907 [Didymella sp. IMI 355093]|nr:hypothetical protein N0V86_005907 [Didymella sp. IMI 355093]
MSKMPYPTNRFNSARNPKLATVLVGSELERFVVHESVLTHHSDFFRAALTGGFTEATEKMVKLKEEDSDIFEYSVHWLYYQRFPENDEFDNPELVKRFAYPEEDYPDIENAIKLYIFGEKYGIKELRKNSLDLLCRIMDNENSPLPANKTVKLAFRCLSHRDPLLRLLVDMFLVHGKEDSDELVEIYGYVPFLQAMWRRYIVYSNALGDGEEMLVELDPCNYHDHTSDGEMTACKKRREIED